jgi:hypothetical protein
MTWGEMIKVNRINIRWPSLRSREGFRDKTVIEKTVISFPFLIKVPAFLNDVVGWLFPCLCHMIYGPTFGAASAPVRGSAPHERPPDPEI